MVEEASPSNKRIARVAADAFGGTPTFARYWDDNHRRFVDEIQVKDRPTAGVTSYSTIGLSDWPNLDQGVEHRARVELVGACGTEFAVFGNALATAAFCVVNSQWFCYPGRIFPDVLAMHDASLTMKHFLFVPPFLWDDAPVTLDLPDKTVAWLQAVPISNAELELARRDGSGVLEQRFVAAQIDVFDLHRPSVV